MQLAQIAKTNKVKEVIVLLKKLNEAVVLVKILKEVVGLLKKLDEAVVLVEIYSPSGQTNVNNKHNLQTRLLRQTNNTKQFSFV